MDVKLIETWDELWVYAIAGHSCFLANSTNCEKGRAQWDAVVESEKHKPLPDRTVLYWGYSVNHEARGYVRLLAAHEYDHQPKTWAMDYCIPFDYEAIYLVAQQMPGVVLCKMAGQAPSKMIRLYCSLKTLERYTYHQQSPDPGQWLVVPRDEVYVPNMLTLPGESFTK